MGMHIYSFIQQQPKDSNASHLKTNHLQAHGPDADLSFHQDVYGKAGNNTVHEQLFELGEPVGNGSGCAGSCSRSQHDFSRIPVYTKASSMLQSKLAANTPGDAYKEAERRVNQVMRMPELQHHECKCGGSCPKCKKNQQGNNHLQTNSFQQNGHSSTIPRITHKIKSSTSFAHSDNQLPFSAKKRSKLLPKLRISNPGDVYEKEADRVADAVMAESNLTIGRISQGVQPKIYREIMRPEDMADSIYPPEGETDNEPDDTSEPEEVQRRAIIGASTITPQFEQSLQQAIHRGGENLPASSRTFMENRFGRDFSSVRVHTDEQANSMAQKVNARAFTLGNDIFFARSEFQPENPGGQHLLAHELTHVVQQSNNVKSPAVNNYCTNQVVQRDDAAGSATARKTKWAEYTVPIAGGLAEIEKELLRLGILKPGLYDSAGFLGNGYYFANSSGSGDTFRNYRVVDAIYIRNDKGDVVAYRVISYLQSVGSSDQGTPSGAKVEQGAKPAATKPKPKKSTSPGSDSKAAKPKPPAPVTSPKEPEPVDTSKAKTKDEILAELKALPDEVKTLLGGEINFKAENLEQLKRIADKLKKLEPEDLKLYKLIANKLASDLDSFERSIDFFLQFKAKIKEQAGAEQTQQKTSKEPTLEEKLSATWSDFDEKKFGGMNTDQKESLARDMAAKQRNIQLEHMAEHPGETALNMAEGIVRVDKTAKAIAEDVKEAADGNKGAYTRLAGAVGAYNKYVAGAASIVFVALLFVPGVNLVELAVAGLAVGAATIVLSVTESELRIKAAGEAKDPEDFKTQTAKSAAAQTQAVVAAAMIALTLAMKIIARIPLPGRYQNVGTALKAAQTALIDKTGVGTAWQSIKTDLLSKLRMSKKGLPEALVEQTTVIAETAKAVEGMNGDQFLKQLADGDPKLADLGISADQAKAIQEVAKTPEGKNIPDQLRKDSLKALQDAPVEAAKKVDQFINKVDESIGKIEKAGTPEELRSAVDDAAGKLSAEEQAKQAVVDEQAFVKKRLQSARKSSVREQAQKKLETLQTEKVKTQAEILRLEKEMAEANLKVNRLKQKVNDQPAGSPERAQALKEFKEAKAALEELREADELGGYKQERSKQAKTEEEILASLELKRPSLWQSTKDAIKKAAKRNSDGKFLDANTGEVIEGEPVYGHKYGRENRRLILEASEKGMTQEQFNNWVNEHPEWFQTETKANNESHRFEKPGVD